VDTVLAVRSTTPPNPHILAFFQALLPARQALELGDWARARALPIPTAPDSGRGWSAGLVRFACGLGAARPGDTTGALAEMAMLDTITRHLEAMKDTSEARSTVMERHAVKL